MASATDILIPDSSLKIFNDLISSLNAGQAGLVAQVVEEILWVHPKYATMVDFRKPVQKVEAVFLKSARHCSHGEQLLLKRSVVAKLALHTPKLLAKINLPASIFAQYPAAFDRLADFLTKDCHEPYDSKSEFFCKDIRFVLALSVPCGAQIVDLKSKIRLRTVILSFLRTKKVTTLKKYFKIKGYKTWFQIHTESRYLADFSEHGWDRCYRRIAELLEYNLDIAGVVGTSWFYDSELLQISPRLAYLQTRPLEAGAFFIKHGAASSDIANAIKTSKTRRHLYYKGCYAPVCYSMVWAREELIKWANNRQALAKAKEGKR